MQNIFKILKAGHELALNGVYYQRKKEVSSFIRSNVMEGWQNLKVGHVNLPTPLRGSFTIRFLVLAETYLSKKKRSVYLYPFKSYWGGPKI